MIYLGKSLRRSNRLKKKHDLNKEEDQDPFANFFHLKDEEPESEEVTNDTRRVMKWENNSENNDLLNGLEGQEPNNNDCKHVKIFY